MRYNRYYKIMGKLKQQKAKARQAAIGIFRVLVRPRYALLAAIVAFGFAVIVFLLINYGFYGSLLFSKLSIIDKINVLGNMITQMSVDLLTTLDGLLLLIVSLLQGISIAILVFVIKKNRQPGNAAPARQLGVSGFTAVAAAIGLGCVPCGTSILLPIISVFLSGSVAASAINGVSLAILVLALLLSLYALSRTGYIAYIYTEEGGEDVPAK